jgi:hypothetical protein
MKYEYISKPLLSTKQADAYVKIGWELIDMHRFSDGIRMYYMFKRPVPVQQIVLTERDQQIVHP